MADHCDYGDDEMPECAPLPKRRANPERTVHVSVKRYLESVLPKGSVVAWIRNEVTIPHYIDQRDGLGRARYVAKLRASGLKPGMPDLLACLPDRETVFFEIKPVTGGRVSADQKVVHMQLNSLGHRVAVVRSIEDVRDALREWGVPLREAA